MNFRFFLRLCCDYGGGRGGLCCPEVDWRVVARDFGDCRLASPRGIASPAQHATVMQNFTDAILDGTPLIVPGEEGMNSVEIANAALYSTWTDKTVELPLDGAAYEKELRKKIETSRFEKKVVKTSDEDFTKSFVR